MKPLWSNIIVAILVIACAIAGFNLYGKVVKEDALQKKVKTQETEIKKKLLFYGTIQKISLNEQGKYLANWDEFRAFTDTAKIVVTQRKEEIKELYFGKDTSIVTIDTIKITTVKDSILEKTPYRLKDLEFVPDEDNARTFVLWTGYVDNKRAFEIKDPEPINKRRQQGDKPGQTGELDTLRLGSRREVKTSGNWR